MSVKVGDPVTVKGRAGNGTVLFVRNSGECNVEMGDGARLWVRPGDLSAAEPVRKKAAPKFED